MIPGILLYIEDLRLFDGTLTDEDLGKVVRGMMTYAEKGEEAQSLSPVARIAYCLMKQKMDREILKYNAKVENGKLGGRPPKNLKKPNKTEQNLTKPNETEQNQKEKEKEKETEYETESETVFFKGDGKKEKRGCKPPTLDEVKEYVRTAGIETDAEAFFDYFSSCGWMRGVNPMTDWQAACRSWKNNRGKQIIPINAKRGSVYNYQERETEPTSTTDQQMEEFMRQQEAAR